MIVGLIVSVGLNVLLGGFVVFLLLRKRKIVLPESVDLETRRLRYQERLGKIIQAQVGE